MPPVRAKNESVVGVLCTWLTDKTLPLIPHPLLPQGEKGSKTIAGVLKAPLPLWERGLG